MKDLLQVIAIMLTIAVLFSALSHAVDYTTYYKDAVIVEIDDNRITVEDTTGNLWIFYGDGYTIGQKVRLTLDTRDTIEYKNDVIKAVD